MSALAANVDHAGAFLLVLAAGAIAGVCIVVAVTRHRSRAAAMRRHPAAGELVVPAGMDASEVVEFALWEMELEDHR